MMLRILLGATVVVLCWATEKTSFHTVVHRIPSMKDKMIKEGKWSSFVTQNLQMLNKDCPNCKHVGQSTLHGYYDIYYAAQITIGTPKQTFWFDMDTGSGDIWVADKSCNVTKSVACKNMTKFDNETSTTYEHDGRPWEIKYGKGFVKGFLGIDHVSIAGLKVTKQKFAQAYHVSHDFAFLPDFDGICGLGFKVLTVDHTNTLFGNIMKQDKLKRNLFTYYIAESSEVSEPAGLITWGDYDPHNCVMTAHGGHISWTPVTRAAYWQIASTKWTLGEHVISEGTLVTIVDTGTTQMLLPIEDFQRLLKLIPQAKPIHGQKWQYTVPCDITPPELTITIEGHVYVITHQEYIKKFGSDHCELGISVLPSFIEQMWLIGDVFLRKYCTVYDFQNQKVGFATARH